MPECFACHGEITDPKGQDVLEIFGIDNNDSRRLLNAFNYIPSIQYRPNYIHFRCASEHADLLGRTTGTSGSNGEYDNLKKKILT